MNASPSLESRLSQPRVDIAFSVTGQGVPRDHGYPLFSALCHLLGDLHGVTWLAVHPLTGVPDDDRMLRFPEGVSDLRLRIVPAELPRILPLSGATLDVAGCKLIIGVPRIFALTPARSLDARLVVIKGFTEPAPFAEAVTRHLAALGIAARVLIGRRRVIRIAGRQVIGFGVELHDLSDAASLVVQYEGLGGRQRLGCGVFTPFRRGTIKKAGAPDKNLTRRPPA